MNFADIEHAWQSPQNHPSKTELEKQKMKMLADLRRRRRGFVIFITLVLAALAFITGQVIFQLVRPDAASDHISLAREWGVVMLLALPWAGALLLLMQYRRHTSGHEHAERSIADSARALLDENRLSRTRVKVAAVLHGAFLLLMPLLVYQLRAAGKAGDEIIVPAFVVWPLIAGAIGLALLHHYRRKLLPQKRQLEDLLASYW